MKEATWDKLEKQFEEFPSMKAGIVQESEIELIEKKMGVQFTSDYKEFISKYGGAIIGPFPIYGLRHAELMDDELWSVSTVTKHFIDEGWVEMSGTYIISTDHSDNPIGVNKNGEVISYDHDSMEMLSVADSFEGYLEKCLTS